jgi:DNA-binding CsgD family transcriptional regulator
LRRAMETLQSDSVGLNRSFPVRAPDTQVALIAHVVPIRRSARDLFAQCVGVLILMPAKTPQAPSVELVQSLFDLTAAEARVARHSLTMGQTVDEIASEKGVSSHTVRSQVRGVLEKTGSRRQADVIALLGRIGALWGLTLIAQKRRSGPRGTSLPPRLVVALESGSYIGSVISGGRPLINSWNQPTGKTGRPKRRKLAVAGLRRRPLFAGRDTWNRCGIARSCRR